MHDARQLKWGIATQRLINVGRAGGPVFSGQWKGAERVALEDECLARF